MKHNGRESLEVNRIMSQNDLVGQRLGKYEIRAEIGKGGMGVVFLGYDPDLDRRVAIKVLAPHLVWEESFVERFLREARAAARLNHPNLVTIHDVGQQGQWYYFVMEYLEGQTLAEIVQQRGTLSLNKTMSILRSLADALDYAHSQGLVHRDIKPANVVVASTGRVVLTDFGIARAAQETGLTRTGTVVGTPQYMSPQQARGEEVDYRTDIYSLGIVAYQLLSGRVPFKGETPHAVLHQQIYEPPPTIKQVRPDLPAGIGPVLAQVLAKEPAERYPSVGAFVQALGQALSEQAANRSVCARPAPQPRRAMPTSPKLLAGVAILLLLVLVAAVFFVLLGDNLPSAEELSLLPTSGVPPGPTVALKPTKVSPQATALPLPASTHTTLYQVEAGDTVSLYATDLQGSGPHLLVSGADAVSPRISPDGTRVAVGVKRDDLYTVYLMNPDGSARQTLTSDRTFAAAYFSDDGKKIRLYARDAVEGANTSGYKYDLAVMDSNGSNPVTLVNQADYASSSWTADGKRLALSVKRGDAYSLYVVGSDGSGQQTISDGHEASYNARLSDDGRWLCYQTYDGETRRFYLSKPDGSQSVELFSGFYSAWPFFSPSGDNLLINLVQTQGDLEELYAVDTGSGQSWRLIAGENLSDISFSPDETWVGAEVKQGGLYRIQLFSIDGAQQKEIVGPGEGADWYASVDFSPDGRRLLVRLGYRETGTTDLYVMNVDGGQRVELVHRADWPVSAAFTPDGESIIFDSNRDGGRTVYVSGADGSQPQKLIDGFKPMVAGGRPAVMYSPRPMPRSTATPVPTTQAEPSND